MPGPQPCHCRPFIFCIVGRGLDPSAASRFPIAYTKNGRFARSRSPAAPLTAMLLFPRQQHRQHGLFHVDAVLRLVENFVGVGFQHIGGDLLAAVGGCGWSFWRKPAPPPCPADPSGPRRPCAATCTRRPHPECAEFPRTSCRPASADVSYAFLQYAAQNRQRVVHVVRRQDQRRQQTQAGLGGQHQQTRLLAGGADVGALMPSSNAMPTISRGR